MGLEVHRQNPVEVLSDNATDVQDLEEAESARKSSEKRSENAMSNFGGRDRSRSMGMCGEDDGYESHPYVE